MAGARGSISLADLLIRLLYDHVPKEVAYQEALYQHTKGSQCYGDELEGDPPIWERTAWDSAVRWLAQRSAYFHGIGLEQESAIESYKHPNAAFADPTRYGTAIEEYERRLREYLADVIQGGPNQSNPAAAELLEFERQGVAAELCKALGDDLPESIQQQLASAQSALQSTSGLGSLVDEIRAKLYPDITDAILAAARTMYRPNEEPAVNASDKPPEASNEQSVDVGRSSDDDAMRRLLSLFTGGMSDDRFHTALGILQNDKLNTDEKLKEIDAAIRLPAIASAEKLGQLLGVSKQAVLKTDWWAQNRRGEKANEIGRRDVMHRERVKLYESDDVGDENE